MYFRHSAEIWRQFPQLVAGLLLLEGIQAEVKVEGQLQPWFEQARERLRQGPESQMAEVAAWRRAYSQMGLKPTKYRSASEALLRRFKREDDLPRLHPLVDLCNALSVAFALPVAVFDLAKIDGYIEVRLALGHEQYLAFNGQVEKPAPNEVIFVDAADRVHARRWTFRQSLRSVISPQTSQALIVSEGLHETAAADVAALIGTLADIIAPLWSISPRRTILTVESPQFDI